MISMKTFIQVLLNSHNLTHSYCSLENRLRSVLSTLRVADIYVVEMVMLVATHPHAYLQA